VSKYSLRKKKEMILSEEAARDQIVELLEYYDIDVDRNEVEDAVSKQVENTLDQLTLYVRQGVLEIARNDKGKLEVKHNLSGGDTLVYGEINSKAKLAMEKFDPKAGYSRTYAFMGSLCGLGKGAIEKLPAIDLGVVEVLGTVFMTA
jgi:hypothetical protein